MIDSTARYRAIPSLEDQVYHSGDHEDSRDGSPTTSEPIPAAAGAKWTYFLLGCAILLPFNGDTLCHTPPCSPCSRQLLSSVQFDVVFLVPTGRLLLLYDIQFVLV